MHGFEGKIPDYLALSDRKTQECTDVEDNGCQKTPIPTRHRESNILALFPE